MTTNTRGGGGELCYLEIKIGFKILFLNSFILVQQLSKDKVVDNMSKNLRGKKIK